MSKDQHLPTYHVLNFFHDNDNACALTVLVQHVRYHIIVDPSQLKEGSEAGTKFEKEYETLLKDAKEKEIQEYDEIENQESQSQGSDRISSVTHDSGVDVDDVSESAAKGKPSSKDPRKALNDWILEPLSNVFDRNKPQSSSHKDHTVQRWYHCQTYFYHLEVESTRMTAVEEEPSDSLFDRIKHLVPSLTLPKYILNLDIPIVSAEDLVICSEASDPDPIHPALVRNRKTNKTHFLKVVDPTQPGPTKREIRLMKTIESKGLHKQMRVPLVHGLVTFDEASSSFSSRDNNNDTPKSKKTSIMGFLMSAIEDPTPLTYKLDESVPQEKRDGWAKEAERMVKILHDNDIIWGDAKGDNFVVDKDENLWIIDFGGSYTPGWIDPELKDTEEGDDQGLRRLVNGLKDPVDGTVGSEDEDGDEEEEEGKGEGEDGGEESGEDGDEEIEENGDGKVEKSDAERGGKEVDESYGGDDGSEEQRGEEETENRKKRKAEEVEGLEDEKEDSAKQQRTDEDDGKSEYCICGNPESGPMIACDGEDCETEWFHMACVGIQVAPKGEWFCKSCSGN